MAVRSPNRLAVSRHVYLRTQQRRLRHVRSIIVRNLSVADSGFDLDSPLALATHFTIQPSHSNDTVLYESEPAVESYNPSWEAIHFTSSEYSKYSALSDFTLKVWMSHFHGGKVITKNSRVVLEKTVSLTDLAYLGTMVNKDGSGYPPNTLVVGMFEGYYTHPTVYGVIAPPKVMHSMTDLLPPMSLLEVTKAEVLDSYHHPTLKRILNRQEVLNTATSEAKQRREAVKRYKMKEQTYFAHRLERERLAMQVKMLQQQLQEQELTEENERKTLIDLKEKLDQKEESLCQRVNELSEEKEQYMSDYQHHCKRMDTLAKFERFRSLRERTMVHELGQTFFMAKTQDAFTICNIILPNADQHDQPNIQDQLGVALGYVAQLVHHLAATLNAPLHYPLHLHGSKSSIYDYISDISAVQNNRDFPLFPRGSEKEVFMYAVYLLNKDICQLRQYTGHGISKSLFKHTLPNLKALIDRLTAPVIPHVQPEVEISLQPISVPTPPTSSTHPHSDSREPANMTASPSLSLVNDNYRVLPSDSLYQERGDLQRPRDSASPETTAEATNQMQSPPLQFELHDAFLQTPRGNHAHPARGDHAHSSAYPIQPRPSSMFPLLSPIYSEGSPIPSEERGWMTQSHSHADLHKEHEPRPSGVSLQLAAEEEELGAVGGGATADVILLTDLSSNGIDRHGNSEPISPKKLPVSDVLATPPMHRTVFEEAEQPEQQEMVHNEQELPLSDEVNEESSMNPFKEGVAPPVGIHQHFPNGSGYMKLGLATPHMISSGWNAEREETQVNYTTQTRELERESPGKDTQFLEDFID